MPEVSPGRYLVQAGWDDVPHLDEAVKAEYLQSIPPHLRETRTQGIPSMGAGAIYPIPLEEVSFRPTEAIPHYWPRGYALDVGWKKTAAVWGAWDRETDTIYCYAEHYRGQAVPEIHAAAIKARGDWMQGCIDPASRGRSQDDGTQLLASYREQGLHLIEADNSVEAGIYEVWSRLETGRLKLSTNLKNLAAEYRMYRRDENGKIVKEFDHLMDALRYLCLNHKKFFTVKRPVGAVMRNVIGDSDAGY